MMLLKSHLKSTDEQICYGDSLQPYIYRFEFLSGNALKTSCKRQYDQIDHAFGKGTELKGQEEACGLVATLHFYRMRHDAPEKPGLRATRGLY